VDDDSNEGAAAVIEAVRPSLARLVGERWSRVTGASDIRVPPPGWTGDGDFDRDVQGANRFDAVGAVAVLPPLSRRRPRGHAARELKAANHP
jgi:hypothetical protein